MNQQEVLLQHLINIYTEKGVSLDSLMKSSFFQSLPVEKKLEIIRAVGQNAKNKSGLTSSDKRKILLGLGAGILGAGLTALTVSNFSTSIKLAKKNLAEGLLDGTIKAGTKFNWSHQAIPLVSIGAATSLLGTSGSNLAEVYRNHQDRQALRNMDLSNDNAILQHLIHREN